LLFCRYSFLFFLFNLISRKDAKSAKKTFSVLPPLRQGELRLRKRGCPGVLEINAYLTLSLANIGARHETAWLPLR